MKATQVASVPTVVTADHKYINLLQELYRAFDFFNQKFAEGKLIRPVIMVASAAGKNAYGWFGNKSWSEGKEEECSEINLSAEYLSRECDEVLETLLHEMAHLKNAQNDIFDCSKTQYHNKAFKVSAEMFGLKVEKVGYKGYAKTSLDEQAKEAIAEFKPNRELFKIYMKQHPKKTDDRYIPLIVNRNDSMVDLLEGLGGLLGSKKNAVTEALWALYNKKVKKGELPELEREDEEGEG